jgi:hypothetical protein
MFHLHLSPKLRLSSSIFIKKFSVFQLSISKKAWDIFKNMNQYSSNHTFFHFFVFTDHNFNMYFYNIWIRSRKRSSIKHLITTYKHRTNRIFTKNACIYYLTNISTLTVLCIIRWLKKDTKKPIFYVNN